MAKADQDDQLALDEVVIEDPVVEKALIERQDRKNALASVRAEYQRVHDAAKVAIERLELPDGKAARVGRFRIERRERPARAVSFETGATTQLRITYLEDGE